MKEITIKGFRTIFILFFLTWICFPVIASEKNASKGKAAIVNGTVITQDELDREMLNFKKRFEKMGTSPGESELLSIKKKIMENLINNELLFQESQKKGVSVEDNEINRHWANLKRRFPNDIEFKKALEKANLSETLVKFRIKRGLCIKKLIDQKFAKELNVTDNEMKTYYNNHPESFKRPEQVRASHILIKVDPSADEQKKKDSRKKIENVQARLKKGEDFATLAKTFSEGPTKVKGGDLGYFGRGQMVKPFEDVAFALKKGDISDIVETKFGYHLIKVVDKRPQSNMRYEDIKDRLNAILRQEKMQKEVNGYLSELKKEAKVERFINE